MYHHVLSSLDSLRAVDFPNPSQPGCDFYSTYTYIGEYNNILKEYDSIIFNYKT